MSTCYEYHPYLYTFHTFWESYAMHMAEWQHLHSPYVLPHPANGLYPSVEMR